MSGNINIQVQEIFQGPEAYNILQETKFPDSFNKANWEPTGCIRMKTICHMQIKEAIDEKMQREFLCMERSLY